MLKRSRSRPSQHSQAAQRVEALRRLESPQPDKAGEAVILTKDVQERVIEASTIELGDVERAGRGGEK